MKHIYTTTCLLFCCLSSFAQWNSNTSLNLEVAGLNVADLQTATTSDGKTWVAFYNNNAGNYDMRAQLLDANGNKLLGPDGVLVCDQPSGSATFVFNVCLDASNNLIIAFQHEVSGINTAVITKVNTDGSLPWGTSPVQLGAGLAPYPALLTNGETVVAWNNSSPATLYMQKLSATGTTVWGSPIAVTVGATNTTRGQIVANPNGYFTMVMQRKGVGVSTTLFAQRYSNDGVAQWPSAIQLSTRTTSGARYYSILVDADTTFFGYYASSGSRFFSHVQRINPDGLLPWGENGANFSTYSTGSEPYQQTTNIAHAANSPFIWGMCTYTNTAQSQSGVYVQKFSYANGQALLDPLGKEVYPISANMDAQTGKLALVADDPLFMSYDASYKIYTARLDALGDFVWAGNRVEISSTTASLATPKGRFAFTNLVNNQVVGVWYENRGTEYRAYAQNISGGGVIPVKLTDFRAVKAGRAVNLFWNTSTETNNKGFIIERSTDGVNYQKIDFTASKAIGGNSTVSIDYSFTDAEPLKSYNFYRLKQIDFDDRFVYSKTVLVRFDKEGNLVISNIYPKPAASVLFISVDAITGTTGSLCVVDMNGKLIRQRSIQLEKGNSIVSLDIADLPKGIYYIRLTGNDGLPITEKWIKD